MDCLPALNDQLSAALEALDRIAAPPAAEVRAVFAPYRICPLGAHVDHQGGQVLGRTIAAGTVLAFAALPTSEVCLYSENFGQVSFSLGQPPDFQHWARYAEAAALALGERHPLRRGLVGFVSGTLVGAGLSSSASVGLAYLLALANVNEIALTAADLVQLEYRLEHDFLGLQIGILDPATIVYGQRKALLYIDTVSAQVAPILDAPQSAGVAWLVAYSGVSRQLTQSGFNNRVAECYQAAAILQPGAKRLGEIPAEVFARRQDELPGHLQRRAAHFFSEVQRVENGKQAWAASNLELFGALMNASCQSSIYQYESGSPVIQALQTIVRQAPGVYGSRFSGGGYGGCVVGLVRREQAVEAAGCIRAQFAREHPELTGQAAVYVVEPADGLRMATL